MPPMLLVIWLLLGVWYRVWCDAVPQSDSVYGVRFVDYPGETADCRDYPKKIRWWSAWQKCINI